mmetsp:Transcript_30461/g.70244  ORF Transcript_30461/g.70244 Transcript_30461/m.70244 type:complete len:318 (-) Transcript_30461:1721-2674(-)
MALHVRSRSMCVSRAASCATSNSKSSTVFSSSSDRTRPCKSCTSLMPVIMALRPASSTSLLHIASSSSNCCLCASSSRCSRRTSSLEPLSSKPAWVGLRVGVRLGLFTLGLLFADPPRRREGDCLRGLGLGLSLCGLRSLFLRLDTRRRGGPEWCAGLAPGLARGCKPWFSVHFSLSAMNFSLSAWNTSSCCRSVSRSLERALACESSISSLSLASSLLRFLFSSSVVGVAHQLSSKIVSITLDISLAVIDDIRDPYDTPGDSGEVGVQLAQLARSVSSMFRAKLRSPPRPLEDRRPERALSPVALLVTLPGSAYSA